MCIHQMRCDRNHTCSVNWECCSDVCVYNSCTPLAIDWVSRSLLMSFLIFVCYVVIESRSTPRVTVHPELVERQSVTTSMEPVDSPSPPSYADLEK